MTKRQLSDHSDDYEEELVFSKAKRPRWNNTAYNMEQFQITELPFDCWMHVFSKINIWHHNRIRATCKYFQEAHNQYLEHEFLKALYKFSRKSEENTSAAILKSIKQATYVYKNVGYESTMFNCLLSLLRRAYRTPFDLENHSIKVFLTSFFTAVDKRMENPNSHCALVLYMMTILNLLKSFRNYEFTTIEKGRNLWLRILVPNIWIGTLCQRIMPSCDKCNAILVILTLLLVGNISVQAVKYVHEFENEVFLFGSDGATADSQNSKTEFKIKVSGSEKLHSFFKKWMDDSTDQEIDLPDSLCTEQFQFEVKIACKTATHWGCPSSKIWNMAPRS